MRSDSSEYRERQPDQRLRSRYPDIQISRYLPLVKVNIREYQSVVSGGQASLRARVDKSLIKDKKIINDGDCSVCQFV